MPFPKHIDNTIREAFVICPTKAKRAFVDDLGVPESSVHLHAGGAMAAGLDVTRKAFYRDGKTATEALELGVQALRAFYGDFDTPTGSYKTKDNMEQALRYYFDTWPLDADPVTPIRLPDGDIGTEWRFAVPIPGLVHPDDGGDVIYVGRSDMIVDTSNGGEMVEDDKTASSLGSQWVKQWQLASQFTGYAWARRVQTGRTPDGVLVRGTSILSPKYDKVEIPAYEDGCIVEVKGRGKVKEEHFYKSVYNRALSFGNAQALTYRPDWVIDRWLAQLQRDLKRMIHAYINDEWDLALHPGACNAYGGCAFADLCLAERPEDFIPINFVKRKWDPLADV